MTLLELTATMTSVAFFASAVATAKHTNAGLGGYIVAIIIGSLLAIANAWGLYKIVRILADLPISLTRKQEEWFGVAFWLLVLLWGLVGAILAGWVTSAILQLVA